MNQATDLDHGLIALCTRRPVAMTMVVLTALVFGLLSFSQLPRNLMPDISYPTVTVRTQYPGAAPLDVEDRVSERLEDLLSQVKGLKRISSISRAELSEIILEFAWDSNMSQATMDVRERVDQTVLPDEAESPTILRYDPTLDPILQLGFYREGSSARSTSTQEQTAELIDLRIEAEELIEKELEFVSGVAAVEVRGGYEREIRIDVDENLLTARELTMDLVVQRIAEENQNFASGMLYHGDQSYIVRAVNEFEDLDEIRDIVLTRDEEVPVRLSEVATVEFGYKDPEVLTRFDGAPCVKIDVFKEAEANIVDVAERVRDRVYGTPEEQVLLKELIEKERRELQEPLTRKKPDDESKEGKKDGYKHGSHGHGRHSLKMKRRPTYLESRLAEGEKIVVMSDQSDFIRRSLAEVRWTAVVGGLFAILVLYAFLRRLWFTAIVGLAIPLSVIVTFAMMKLSGVSLNIMSLGGLALGVGMLVDNSIVVLENIFRCREEGDAPRVAAVRGARSVAGAVTASTLTTVAVFFPIVFVEGIAGQIFRDQAIVVVISLLASLVVSLTFIPTLVSRKFSGMGVPEGGWFDPSSRYFDGAYFRGLRGFVKGRAAFLLVFVALTLTLVGFVGAICEVLGRLLWHLARALVAIFGLLVRWISRPLTVVSHWCLERFGRAWQAIENFYPRTIESALRGRALVILIAALCASGAGVCFSKIGSELIPEVHQGEFTVEVALPVGTRLEKTDEVIKPLEDSVRRLDGVESLATTLGVEEDSTKAGEEGEHTARLLVRAKKDRAPALVEEELKQAIREIFSRESQIDSLRIRNPVLFSFKTPIEVEIKSFNLERLGRVARQMQAVMLEIDSIKDVKLSLRRGYPEIHVKPRRDVLMRHDLNLGAVGTTIRRKVKGEVPSRFSEKDRKVDIRVRLQESDRSSVGDLRALVVNSTDEVKIPLEYVAEIFEAEGPAEIRRIDQSRAAIVTANLAGLDLGRATQAISDAAQKIDIPPDTTVGFGGQQTEMEFSRRSLIRALILAIFLVYVVMAAQFESLLQPFVILFSIPLAGVGIAPVLYYTNEPLSIIVFIGMIVLAGIVVNNAIVLIDCINQLRQSGVPKLHAIARAGQLRLRPICMTTITTVLGLLPLTGILNDVPLLGPLFVNLLGVGEGLEIRAPMAITVIAGLLASTLLTLIVIPVVYSFTDARD